jgi:hypothetical protein
VPFFIALSWFFMETYRLKMEPVDFVVPVLFCGLLLHFYHWVMRSKIGMKSKMLFSKKNHHTITNAKKHTV